MNCKTFIKPTLKSEIMNNLIFRIGTLFCILTLFTGCELVEGIFKVGMGVGIFIVIAIIAVVVFIISRFRK